LSDEPPHHAGAGTGLQRISVIIPARNERDSLPAVLKELPRDRLGEIIVIDGHSTDGTPELVRDLGFTAITQDGRGYGMGVISGITRGTISSSAHAIGRNRAATTTPGSGCWATRYSRFCCEPCSGSG